VIEVVSDQLKEHYRLLTVHHYKQTDRWPKGKTSIVVITLKANLN